MAIATMMAVAPTPAATKSIVFAVSVFRISTARTSDSATAASTFRISSHWPSWVIVTLPLPTRLSPRIEGFWISMIDPSASVTRIRRGGSLRARRSSGLAGCRFQEEQPFPAASAAARSTPVTKRPNGSWVENMEHPHRMGWRRR